MSIIVGFAYQKYGWISTDTQETYLDGRSPSFDAQKAEQICDGLAVGYCGEHELGAQVISEATTAHRMFRRSNSTAEFIQSLKTGFHAIEMKYGLTIWDQHNVTVMVVGQGENDDMDITLFGTATQYKEVPIKSNTIGMKLAFLPPPDLSYQQCLTIAYRILSQAKAQSVETICNAIILEISAQSDYCGGAPRTLSF